MVCLNDIKYDILLKDATPKECEDLIMDICDEVYYVKAGYKIRDIALVGSEQIPAGIRNNSIVFRFIKPCTGLFVLEIKDALDEIERLRNNKENIRKK